MLAVVRYFFVALGAVAIAGIGFAAHVYNSNVRMLEGRHPVTRAVLPTASDAGASQRGKRLADVTGCTDCHRPDLRGGIFIDEGWLHGRYYASNLTRKARLYSDEDLARIVRLGVRPDGRGAVAMPSMGYVRLTDLEMADIIAFVRSMPEGGVDQPGHFIGPLDHWDFWRAVKLKMTVSYVEAERAKEPPSATGSSSS